MYKKNYNLNISFLRFAFCISVLLYHLKVLKGGYLAVCSFFVLAGYFCVKSIYSKSLIKHYIKRFKKIYLPIIIVLFSTISLLNIFNINIFNIKPEITSVLFGYNNYFQINTNADYFAKHIDSPFMHLWYIAILLQLEIVFGLIMGCFKKIKNKVIPCIILLFIGILSTIYFYISPFSNNIMVTYYDTFSRLFSFALGVFLGFYHSEFNKNIVFKNINLSKLIFVFYLIILFVLFIFIDPSSNLFRISMILTTILTLRLIEYGKFLFENNVFVNNKIINFISSISYEIYLVQYPVIYLFNYVKLPSYLEFIFITVITILVSWLINLAISSFKKNKLRIIPKVLFSILVLYGGFKYISMKDYTNEINTLKKELSDNQKIMEQKQREYLEKQKKDEEEWNSYLESLDNDSSKLYEYVTNLKVVGIGDSIMLDAIPRLYKAFPNGYFDAKVSRSTCAGAEVLKEVLNTGATFDVFIFNLGTNDTPTRMCKDRLMNLVGDKKVFWLTATHPDDERSNPELIKYASEFDNIYILDWVEVVKKHSEYLYSDYTHLRPVALSPYVDFIKESVYQNYLNDYKAEKEKIISKHNEEEKNKISFYGNELLLNIFNNLQENFPDAKFEAEKSMNFKSLSKELEKGNLNKKLVFVFDKTSNISKSDFKKIIDKYKEYDIYIVSINNNLNIDGANVINFNAKKKELMADGVHLNDTGIKNLVDEITKSIK